MPRSSILGAEAEAEAELFVHQLALEMFLSQDERQRESVGYGPYAASSHGTGQG